MPHHLVQLRILSIENSSYPREISAIRVRIIVDAVLVVNRLTFKRGYIDMDSGQTYCALFLLDDSHGGWNVSLIGPHC